MNDLSTDDFMWDGDMPEEFVTPGKTNKGLIIALCIGLAAFLAIAIVELINQQRKKKDEIQ